MRRAGVWSALAFQRTRRGESAAAEAAAKRALAELAAVDRRELADDDLPAWNDAAMRVGASRWAARRSAPSRRRGIAVVAVAGEPGQTCVLLVDARVRPSEPAGRALHLWRRLDRVGDAQPRRQRPRPGGAADGRLARAVGLLARRRKGAWSVAGAAARDRHARARLCRVRRLGAGRPADAGAREARARQEPQAQLRGRAHRHAVDRASGGRPVAARPLPCAGRTRRGSARP